MFNEFDEMTREIENFRNNIEGVEGILNLLKNVSNDVSELKKSTKNDLDRASKYIDEIKKYQQSIAVNNIEITEGNKEVTTQLNNNLHVIKSELKESNEKLSEELVAITKEVVYDLISGGESLKNNLISGSKLLKEEIRTSSMEINDKVLESTKTFKEEVIEGSQHFAVILKEEMNKLENEFETLNKKIIIISQSQSELEKNLTISIEELNKKYINLESTIRGICEEVRNQLNTNSQLIESHNNNLLEGINKLNIDLENMLNDKNDLIKKETFSNNEQIMKIKTLVNLGFITNIITLLAIVYIAITR